MVLNLFPTTECEIYWPDQIEISLLARSARGTLSEHFLMPFALHPHLLIPFVAARVVLICILSRVVTFSCAISPSATAIFRECLFSRYTPGFYIQSWQIATGVLDHTVRPP